jgi:glycosyltransferase involved in cell wall biosynthesis
MSCKPLKIAFLHRYGLGGWVCCGGHAVPRLAEKLSASAELHFFGPSSTEPMPPDLARLVTSHLLPWQFDRSNPQDKWGKTLRFYLALPGIGVKCRSMGIDFLYWDETLPLGALILKLFYGRSFSIMVMDFFVRIYTEKRPWLHWFRNLVERIDCLCWKQLPLLFVHVQAAKAFLDAHGIRTERVVVVANPCDHAVFHPVDEATRIATRKGFGFSDADIVMTHHGILHPNKGNDWIMRCLARVCADVPNLKFLLIGNGPERRRLELLARQLGVADRVIFAGWLRSELDLSRTLASMDIALVMRIGQETDHFHMTDTLNHEMACGKAILAVNLRGISEFVRDGENGFLFPVENPEVFCQRLQDLAINPLLRKQLGDAALATSSEVSSIETCAARMATAILTAAHL